MSVPNVAIGAINKVSKLFYENEFGLPTDGRMGLMLFNASGSGENKIPSAMFGLVAQNCQWSVFVKIRERILFPLIIVILMSGQNLSGMKDFWMDHWQLEVKIMKNAQHLHHSYNTRPANYQLLKVIKKRKLNNSKSPNDVFMIAMLIKFLLEIYQTRISRIKFGLGLTFSTSVRLVERLGAERFDQPSKICIVCDAPTSLFSPCRQWKSHSPKTPN